MSRSRKKVAVWKLENDKAFKRYSNRMIRHRDIPSGSAYKKVLGAYYICDYRERPHKAEPNERSVRK